MDHFNGLEIPDSLQEVLDPAKLAFVVYDMQVGILEQIARHHEVLHNVRRLLATARRHRVRTIFMRHYFMPTELAGVFQLRQAKTWKGKEHAADTRPLISRGKCRLTRSSLRSSMATRWRRRPASRTKRRTRWPPPAR